MKKIIGALVVSLFVILSLGAACAQESSLVEKEIAIAGSVPAQWGTLKFVLPGPKDYQMRLFFEDKIGTIRIVTFSNVEAMGPDVYTVLWGNVPVIKRSR